MIDLPTLFFSLGSMPMFASRTLTSIFCVAFAARLHAEGLLSFAENLGPFHLDLSLSFPPWLISNQILGVLLLLAVVESRVDKSPALRAFLEEFDPWVKGAGNYIFSNVALASSLSLVAMVQVRQAGLGGVLWTIVPAAGVWLIATLRRSVFRFLTDLDEDDDLGVRKLFSWAEDLWVGAGFLLVVLLPVVAMVVAGLTILGLWLAQVTLRRREERQKVPCVGCGARILPSAPSCFACRTPIAQPVGIGVFGQPTLQPAGELSLHRLRLLAKKRCLVCATHLPQKRLRQQCSACGNEMLPSLAWADQYIAYVDSKLPKTLLVCTALGLVPVVGLIPGVIYYRLGLVSAMRAYVPPATGCMTRWLVRISSILLVALQWIPILGAFTLPAMCYLNYRLYRSALVGQKQKLFGLEAASV